MNSITVNVSDLFDKVKALNDAEMDFVELCIKKPLDEFSPSCIHFTASTALEPYLRIDYDSVEEIEDIE